MLLYAIDEQIYIKRERERDGKLYKAQISVLKKVRKAGAKRGTILPMEGNPRHPGSFSFPPVSLRFWPQPDHSHLPSTNYPPTGVAARSSVMAELRSWFKLPTSLRAFDILSIFYTCNILGNVFCILVHLILAKNIHQLSRAKIKIYKSFKQKLSEIFITYFTNYIFLCVYYKIYKLYKYIRSKRLFF